MTEALELEPGLSDGDLVRSAADGDRHAFAEIYDRYADRLYDFCVGLVGDRDAAADCVQDTFCVAATDLGGLREPDKLRPWLYSIARHHAMRRLRHRYREEVSDELPDMVSHQASTETLAAQSELARLVADAAGGLSDRDRELLDLSYRHGLDGPELAETLGVTLTSANTRMFRLRQTVERCLGALLVARGAKANPDACSELATVLKGWDGRFTVLMRKRIARHIDSCDICERDQRRQVNPVALLGGAPVFIPAPEWLRRQTLDRVQLTCAGSTMFATTTATSANSGTSDTSESATGSESANGSRFTEKRWLALIVGIPLLFLGLSDSRFALQEEPVSRMVDTGAESSDGPVSAVPRSIDRPAATGQPQSTPVRAARPSELVGRAQETAGTHTPSRAAGPGAPGTTPKDMLTNPDPKVAPPAAQIDAAPVPNSETKAIASTDQVDAAPAETAPVDTAPVVTAPVDTAPVVTAPAPNPNGTPTGPQVSIGPVDLGLIPKVPSSYPQSNTATITNPNTTSPNLQIGTAQKPSVGTSTNTGTSTDTKIGTDTSTKTTTGTGTNTKTGTSTDTKVGTNTNKSTNTNSKAAGSTSK
jgi:RNA polymerase sigma factor (sigma-70 family)